MTSFPPSPPRLEPGEPVIVEPKPFWKSTSLWGLLVMVVNWRIQKAVQNGTIPEAMAPLVGNAAFEIIGYAVGAAMVAWGRWRAARPLGLTSKEITTVVK